MRTKQHHFEYGNLTGMLKRAITTTFDPNSRSVKINTFNWLPGEETLIFCNSKI